MGQAPLLKIKNIWGLRNQSKKAMLFLYLTLKKSAKFQICLLAGIDIFTGSSIYAGSPGPHLLHAKTLNKYSFPWTRSGTVNSWSVI